MCNSTVCDTLGPVTPVGSGQYVVYTSNKAGLRFYRQVHKFTPKTTHNKMKFPDGKIPTSEVNREHTFQTVLGFGGAFTDAAGINILQLSAPVQEKLIQSYFSTEGIEYTFARVPMAGSDFSTHTYSYNEEEGDFNMTHFNLTEEDHKYKIPLIQRAMDMSKRSLFVYATPWSAPAWMKTSDEFSGKGTLKGEPGGEYYQAWAEYFAKFLEEYGKNNISFWAVTAQNEPTDGDIANFSFNSLGFTAETQREFVAKNLGPTLEKSGFSQVKIIILDDQRLMLPKWAQTVLSDPVANKYVSGIGVHWYLDLVVPAEVLTLTHDKFPDKFILASEACEGSLPWTKNHVSLGSWDRAESYAYDIIQDLGHWVVGWTDWNLALNLEGGPNWAKNFVDSPIIVDAKMDQFYKQPMFYALGQFSKFLQPDAVRIDLDPMPQGLDALAFLNPDNSTVIVALNRKSYPVPISIHDEKQGYLEGQVPAHSIQTFMWWM
uniref:Glucosylceramidase n=1 Tax=Strigamia maritima TaxID=126957 RepID=T1JDD3_STRMM